MSEREGIGDVAIAHAHLISTKASFQVLLALALINRLVFYIPSYVSLYNSELKNNLNFLVYTYSAMMLRSGVLPTIIGGMFIPEELLIRSF